MYGLGAGELRVMSNASDQKVEDVLSSVRRLVSSELPRKPRTQAPEGPGALVLTEAHRIESDPVSKSSERSLEDRIAELEAAVGGQAEEFEPDGSEDQEQHRPSRIVYTRPPASEEEASARHNALRLSQIALIETGPAGDEAEAATEEAPTFRRLSEEPPEAPMAEDVPTVAPVSAEVVAFTDPDDVVQKIEARIVSGRPISEPLQLVQPATEVPAKRKAEPANAAQDTDDFDSALTAAVAASLSATGNTEDTDETADEAFAADDVLSLDEFDPVDLNGQSSDPEVTASELLAANTDEDDAETSSGPQSKDNLTVEVATDDASAKVADEGTDEARDAEAPSPTDANTPPVEAAAAALAVLPDEDALRLMVSRMIREELAGELGERITRNMRKLVRREIKRALSSKDLT